MLTILSHAQATLILDIKALTETRFADLNLLLSESNRKMQSSLTVLGNKLDELPPMADDRGALSSIREADTDKSELAQCVYSIKEMMKSMKQHTDEISQKNEEQASIEAAAGSMKRIMSALDTATQRLDTQDQKQVNDIDPALQDIRQLVETLKVYAAESYEVLYRSMAARDFRNTTSVDQYRSLSPIKSGTLSASPLPLTQKQQHLAGAEGSNSDGATEGSTWHVQAAVRMRCPVTCKCQCHAVTTARTPSILSRVLGTIILSYNSIPVWDSRPCNHPRCLKNSSMSVHLNYLLPVWLPRLAMAFSISWDSVVGSGASLYVNLPRVVTEYSEVFKAIDTNNVPRLQWLFSTRQFLPTDVNQDSVCLLTVSSTSNHDLRSGWIILTSSQYALYMVKSWPAAKVLLDMHPRVTHRDNHGK